MMWDEDELADEPDDADEIMLEALDKRQMRLSGVGQRLGEKTKDWWDGPPAEFLFVVDGRTLVAQEDPEDGYRSCMGKLYITDDKPDNMFPPVKVVGRLCESKHNDIVELVDVVTGEVVIEVGTGDWDDYYPYFVARFMPEAMITNK